MRLLLTLLLIIFSHTAYGEVNYGYGSIYSAKVVDVESSKVIYAHNPQLSLIPASTIKTLTFYLALKYLKSDFKFNTDLLISNQNLYIKFSGDPTLTAEDIEELILLAISKKLNFKNVYLDESVSFGKELYARGTLTDNCKFCFASPITSIMVDKNCARFEKVDSHTLNYKSKWDIINLKYSITETNKVEKPCQFELNNVGDNRYELSGCYNKNEIPQFLKIAVINPKKYVQNVITKILEKHNIAVKEVKFDKAPLNSHLIIRHESKALNELLKDMMQKSKNHIANALIKTITYNYFSKPASWFLVEQFIKQNILQDFPNHSSTVQIMDGSGESYKNKVTSDFMIDLLDRIYSNHNMRSAYFNSIPTIGTKSSTLENRFKELSLNGKIFAKTGGLDNTSNLLGYYIDENQNTFAFCLLINNFMGSTKELSKMQQMLVENILTITD